MRDDDHSSKNTLPIRGGCKLYRCTAPKGLSGLRGTLGHFRVLVLPKPDGQDGDHTHLLILADARRPEGDR